MEYLLKIDVKSWAKKGLVYGKRGTRVKEISISGHVVIVEDISGKRFPAVKCELEPISHGIDNKLRSV